MAKYKISRAEVMSVEENLDDDPLLVFHIQKLKRMVKWRGTLLSGIAEANKCQALKSNLGLYVLGQTSDVQAAQYMYALFLSRD